MPVAVHIPVWRLKFMNASAAGREFTQSRHMIFFNFQVVLLRYLSCLATGGRTKDQGKYNEMSEDTQYYPLILFGKKRHFEDEEFNLGVSSVLI